MIITNGTQAEYFHLGLEEFQLEMSPMVVLGTFLFAERTLSWLRICCAWVDICRESDRLRPSGCLNKPLPLYLVNYKNL